MSAAKYPKDNSTEELLRCALSLHEACMSPFAELLVAAAADEPEVLLRVLATTPEKLEKAREVLRKYPKTISWLQEEERKHVRNTTGVQ